MLPKTTTIDAGHHHHHHVIVGDVLLHSEAKATTIQVIVRTLTATPSLGLEKPIIRRLFPSTSTKTNSHASTPCDLKNPSISTGTHDRILSSKNVLHMPRIGWALAKEIKSKIVATGSSSSSATKTKIVNISGDNERTHF